MNSLRLTKSMLIVAMFLLALTPISTAFAAPPTMTRLDVTWVNPPNVTGCGPVEVHLVGMLIQRQDGNTFSTTGADVSLTFTSLDTGKSVELKGSGLERVTETDDTITYSRLGRNALIVIPGEGAVVRNVGSLTVTIDKTTGDATEVIHGLYTGGDICALIAPVS